MGGGPPSAMGAQTPSRAVEGEGGLAGLRGVDGRGAQLTLRGWGSAVGQSVGRSAGVD